MSFFMSLVGQPKINKVKFFMPVSKLLKRPQTKFHTHTMGDSKAVKSKKNQDLSSGQNFLPAKFFLVSDILLKLQQRILICFC